VNDSFLNHTKKLSDVPPHLLKEIEHFFSVYKDLEEKKVGVEGWKNKEDALKAVRESKERYRVNQK